jgi:hypothetical protein
MAGNTKLRGFGTNNTIQLERWGKEVMLHLSGESVHALRDACTNQLPRNPPTRSNWTDTFNVKYEEATGRVRVDMDPATALQLAEVVGDHGEEVTDWVEDLKDAHQAHEDYINGTDEPGIDQ